jgi:hypothetical protein
MKYRLSIILTLAAFLLLVPATVFGHHGTAGYTITETVTLTGAVTDFHFVNPHSIIDFDVKDDKGQTQKWQGELTSPNHLVRAGWNSTTVKADDQITVTGYRAKSGANSMWITKISVNGQDLKLGAGN